MTNVAGHIGVREGCRPDRLPLGELLEASVPVVLKGLVRDWPLVEAGLRSDEDAMAYLRSFYNGRTVGTYFGAPAIGGRLFYNDDVTDLNFDVKRASLTEVLDLIREHARDP